jgi:hypothetical protein
VGPRAGLDDVKKILDHTGSRTQTPRSSSRYTDYGIPAPGDRVAHLYPQAPASFFVAFYDSQGYGGGILTHLHTGRLKY